MKYGIRNGLLREPIETLFTVAKEIGFDGIEYCVDRDYENSLLQKEAGPEKLKSLADKDGIEISSLSVGGFGAMSPLNPDAAKRAEGRKTLTHAIEVCPTLGTGLILITMPFRDVDQFTEETWKMLADGFKPLVEAAESHRVTLAIETTITPDQFLKVADRIGSQCIKYYYDVANSTNSGHDPSAEIRQLGDQISIIHIKDTDRAMLGEGKVDFKGVSDALRDTGYDGYLILETPTGDDPKAAAAQNLAFTRRLGK